MTAFLGDLVAFTIIGVVTGATLAIAASGLVITYATSNVFNMAHGAISMVMAFVYWQFTEHLGMPQVVGLILVVGIIAPIVGALLERALMRRITTAPIVVSLTVTLGLWVALIGFAQNRWPARDARSVTRFFGDVSVTVSGTSITGHDMLQLGLAAGVAFGLYLLLNRTRTGIAMRAIVDNRTLLSLHGAQPQYLGMLSWAIGSSLAALAGILIVPIVGLNFFLLTLIVINAYAAAMLGRLKSLPATFVGAILLGLAISYFDFGLQQLPDSIRTDYSGILGGLRASLPTIFLLGVMLFLPHEKLRVGAVAGAARVRIPDRRQVAVWSAILFLTIVGLVRYLGDVTTLAVGTSLAIAAIMLTLVLLTGYGGDVSLSQLTFAGIGALVVTRYFESQVGLVALLAAGLVAAIVGAIVAFPALRLRGLYLGLGTLAFAYAMDKLVFETAELGWELGGSANYGRPRILGLDFAGHGAMTVLMAIVFIGYAWLILELRRGRFGRLLLATRDSPAACGTLGLSITRTRVLTFTISAGLAGIAGALFAGMIVSAGATDFAMFENLPLVLLAVAGGITSVTGALIGGFLLGMQGQTLNLFETTPLGVDLMATGLIAILISRQPNGIAGLLFQNLGPRVARWRAPTAVPVDATGDDVRQEVGISASA